MAFIDPYLEMLDDPTVPFSKRWDLISEIDRTNARLGIYSKIMAEWKNFIESQGPWPSEGVSVLEVGSGSGGLSLQLANWAAGENKKIDLHLYESQADVLNESVKKFVGIQPELHVATSEHLKVYKDQQFDYVISLHVLHHIQPLDVAAQALLEMLRISKHGVIVFDLERRAFSVLLSRFINFAIGVSEDLSRDGVKSVYRAHAPLQLESKLKARNDVLQRFHWGFQRYFLWPYWKFEARARA